jgi:hypothetical protein
LLRQARDKHKKHKQGAVSSSFSPVDAEPS